MACGCWLCVDSLPRAPHGSRPRRARRVLVCVVCARVCVRGRPSSRWGLVHDCEGHPTNLGVEVGRREWGRRSVGPLVGRQVVHSYVAVLVGRSGRSEVICLLPATVEVGDGGGGSGLAVLCCGALVWRKAVDPCLLGGVAVSFEVSSQVVAVHLLVIVVAGFRLSCLRSVARAGRGCLSSPFVLSCSCVVVIGSSGPLLPSLSSLSWQLDRGVQTGACKWLCTSVCGWRVIAGVSDLRELGCSRVREARS